MTPTLLSISFYRQLRSAFKQSEEGIHLHTRSDGKLFNLFRLRAKTKVRTVLIREMLFAEDAALTSYTAEDLQWLINQFAQACKEFGLTISIKKTNVIGQDVPVPLSISIGNKMLEVTDHVNYLGSTITNNLLLEQKSTSVLPKPLL